MAFSVLLVVDHAFCGSWAITRPELCNRCASPLTAQVFDFVRLNSVKSWGSLGMNCRDWQLLPGTRHIRRSVGRKRTLVLIPSGRMLRGARRKAGLESKNKTGRRFLGGRFES
jgi:hypothetical protein